MFREAGRVVVFDSVEATGQGAGCPAGTIAQFLEKGQLVACLRTLGDTPLVKAHLRKIRGKPTDLSDYPPEKIAFQMRTPGMVQEESRRNRPALRPGDRGFDERERSLPAPLRTMRDRLGRQAPARTA